jgi:hypothetical protein
MVQPERLAARAERVAGGLVELEQWLRDQVAQGIAQLGQGGYGPIDQMAARMVDAQAPGVAGLLRSLPGELSGEGWPARLLEHLGALHLLIEAHRRVDELPPELAATVRSRVGYPISKADVLAGPGVEDHWYAVGAVDSSEGRLDTRRVWLYGATSRRWALLLSFAPPGGFLDDSVSAGRRLQATLHFYFGSGQYRALVGEQLDVIEPLVRPEPESYAAVQDRFATLLAADPWATRMPAVVRATAVPPQGKGDPWRLRESTGAGRDVIDLPGAPWPMWARSLAGPVDIFGEWSPWGFRPLSLLPDERGGTFSVDLLGQAA